MAAEETEAVDERLEQELPSGDVLVFADFDELVAYCDSELEATSWVVKAAASLPNGKQAAQKLQSPLATLKNLVAKYRNAQPGTPRVQLADQIRSSIQSLGSDREWMPSSDPRLKYAKKVSEDQAETIGGWTFLAFVHPEHVQTNNAEGVSGLLNRLMFEHALTDGRAQAEKEALAEVRAEWDKHAGSSKGEYEDFRTEFLELKNEIGTQRTSQSDEFEELLKEKRGELDTLIELFNKKLAVQAPVEYWQEKVSRHRRRGLGYAVCFALWAVLAVFLLSELAQWIAPGLWIEGTPENPKPAVSLEYWQMVTLATSGGVLVWPGRTLMRLVLSNIHLQTDAEERVVLANTYLALLRGEEGDELSALDAEDKSLILNALFRQASTGIVKDDGLGGSALEQAARLLGGRQ